MLHLIGRYTKIIPIILLAVAGSFAFIQSMRLQGYQGKIEELTEEVSSLRQATALMEDLREQTNQLVSERDDLLRGIRDADGYDTPLPDDVRRILERVR